MCVIFIVFYIDLEKELRNYIKIVVLLCLCIFVLEENVICSVNVVEFWRCL